MEPSLRPLGMVIPAYGMWRQHRLSPVQGWHLNVLRDEIVTNGQWECQVTMRAIGPVELYEVEARIWGAGSVLFETPHVLPKMTCESEPIKLTVHFPVDSEGVAPWVGVTWVEAARRAVMQQSARTHMLTDEYQRWKWNTVRNVFRGPNTRPKGDWKTIGLQRERRRYFVERWEGEGLSVRPKSIGPHKVW
ncbi:hypothetical protein [Nocardia sp. NPDC005745]|uniref:hypothetical protein n=1 Tax=Nocardia sp. NPDC005745 TaxID=3157061 RepID=UPI0033C7CD90